ncbi:Gag [Pyrenophora tritici-repentis]|nr:Gag [Pyrenophora tritici-repentis]
MSQAANPDPMQQILQQLSVISTTLAKQEARHHEEIDALRRELEAFKINSRPPSPPPQTTPLSPTQTTPPLASRRTERLPDPPMFTGKRKDLPLFLTKLRFKLRGNADRYPDEESKLIYAHSRLEHDPATLVDSLINSDITTAEGLMLFLQATYGDPNKELSAWSKLDNLKQGKKKIFLSHFAEFRRLIGDTSLNKAAQISQLRRSLSNKLRHAMVGVKIPQNLNEYANLISLYDNDLRHLPDWSSHRYHT